MLRRSSSIVGKLHERQLGTQQRRLYTQVPARFQFPIESVVDKDKRLLGCILLGLSADGNHLLSYTSTGGYHLQVWSYQWGKQAEYLTSIRLFKGASSSAALGDSDSSDEDAQDVLLGLAVSVIESADQQLLSMPSLADSLSVTAVILAGRVTLDDDSPLADTMNYVTVLPNPCLHRCCLQGCHFKYPSIIGTVSQPLFAFLPPHTLVMHSSHGLQLVHLLIEISQTQSRQAEGSSLHVQPAGQTATIETSSLVMMADTADSQQPVHADTASSQPGRQTLVELVQHIDLRQNLAENEPGFSRDAVLESAAAANSQGGVPGTSVTFQAGPAHSVWSMSASSEASMSSSDMDVPETSPGSPAVASSLERGQGSDCVSFFSVCLSSTDSSSRPPVHCSVTAELATPVFDPGSFVLEHIPKLVLQHHRLTDYAVELLGDGTPMYCQQLHSCTTFQEQQAAQLCANEASVLLLIVAVLKPTILTIHPTGSIKCTELTVSVHASSGIAELLSQRWVKPESTNQLLDNIAYHHSTDICKLAALCLAKAFASRLKSDCIAPQAPHQAPVVLTNEAMLISGKSAGVLLHPFLPICILGYRDQGQLNST